MKKTFFGLIFCLVGSLLFAQVTDAQIRQAANTLGVPYEALKQFVESYRLQPIPSGAISISSVQLWKEYSANELRADAQYKGKNLIITGTVRHVWKDRDNQYFVDLEGEGNFYIRVYFRASETNKLGNISDGQRITIIGICEGSERSNVYIRNSIIQN